MWRAFASVMTILLLTTLTVDETLSNEHGDSKGRMKGMEQTMKGMEQTMKGMEQKMKGMEPKMKGMEQTMLDMPAMPCKLSTKPIPPRPEGFKAGKVVILEPENGAVIKSRTTKVLFDMSDKGDWGSHVHVYLDGRCKKMVMSGKTVYVGGMREGKHKIQFRLVSKEHQEYGPSASIDVTVKLK